MTLATIGADPARIDIEVYAGEPLDFTVPVFDATGVAQDVTDWTLFAQARPSRSGLLLHTFTLAGVAPTPPIDDDDEGDPGGVRVTATPAQTAAWAGWPVSVARWDLWLTPPAGEPSPFAEGWVRVHHTISH